VKHKPRPGAKASSHYDYISGIYIAARDKMIIDHKRIGQQFFFGRFASAFTVTSVIYENDGAPSNHFACISIEVTSSALPPKYINIGVFPVTVFPATSLSVLLRHLPYADVFNRYIIFFYVFEV